MYRLTLYIKSSSLLTFHHYVPQVVSIIPFTIFREADFLTKKIALSGHRMDDESMSTETPEIGFKNVSESSFMANQRNRRTSSNKSENGGVF